MSRLESLWDAMATPHPEPESNDEPSFVQLQVNGRVLCIPARKKPGAGDNKRLQDCERVMDVMFIMFAESGGDDADRETVMHHFKEIANALLEALKRNAKVSSFLSL